MKITEYSETDIGITKTLIKKGYKFLGKGVDQSAYLEPGTGLVLKIFGSQEDNDQGFTPDQHMFFIWAKFCMKNKTNLFLPKFFGYESFTFNDRTYLQIRQERLHHSNRICTSLAELGASLTSFYKVSNMNEAWTVFTEEDSYYARILLETLNKKQILLYMKTVSALNDIGNKQGWDWDLHNENIMVRDNGFPVIVDPWVL